MAGLVLNGMSRRPVAVRRIAHPGEEGVVILYLALVLTALMMFAAFAVDLGLAKESKANTQAAVDTAALSGAQVLVTTASTQAQKVFDVAAATTFKSLGILDTAGGAGLPASTACTPVVTYCQDYRITKGATAYDVSVTTPYTAPGQVTPDRTLLHITSCWGVPTLFGGVIGWKTIPICTSATAQNGAGVGGASNGGCGSTTEFSTISNTFNAPVGAQTISALYSGTFAVDVKNVHFVVQTQYGNFQQLPEGPGGVGVPGVSYSLVDHSGGKLTNATFSYTLPSTIDTSTAFTGYNVSTIGSGAIYSNTFTANLTVIDVAARNCGEASWTTCNPPKSRGSEAHDAIFDGGGSGDVGGQDQGWGTGTNGADRTDDTSGETVKSPVGDGSNISGDGHDVASDEYVQSRNTASNPLLADADDTITPALGTLVTAGWPVGAIYNDEQPLRAAWTYFIVDGVSVPFSSSTWTPGTFSFADPSTVWKYAPKGLTGPTVIPGMPSFGVVVPGASGISRSGNSIGFNLIDNMGNPLPGEKITNTSGASAVTPPASPITALDGSTAKYAIAKPAGAGTFAYTFAYTPAPGAPQWGSGSFVVNITWSNTAITAARMATTATTQNWPAAAHDWPPGMDSGSAGGSVAVVFNTANLTNGWHSAILFANDGDVTTSGGDCGLATWAFGSTGGPPGPGTLHLVS